MNSTNYKDKYLKYKTKYCELKKNMIVSQMIGGMNKPLNTGATKYTHIVLVPIDAQSK